MLAFCGCFVVLGLPLLYLHDSISLSRLLLLAAISAAVGEMAEEGNSHTLKLRATETAAQLRFLMQAYINPTQVPLLETESRPSAYWW
jgi:hypothetical protein